MMEGRNESTHYGVENYGNFGLLRKLLLSLSLFVIAHGECLRVFFSRLD